MPSVALQGDSSIAAFAGNLDQTGLLQHGEVVGDGGGTEGLALFERDAEESFVAGDLAQHGESTGIGDGAGDEFNLLIG